MTKPPWEKPDPKAKPKKLTSSQKAYAKSQAKRKGQVYPSLVANMNAAKRAKKK